MNANVYDIADREARDLLANEEVRQATINLFRALNSTSLNSDYSIASDTHESLLKVSRDQRDVLESPLVSSFDFENQIMQIEFKGWTKSKDNPTEKKIDWKVLNSDRKFGIDDEAAAKLHGMDVKKMMSSTLSCLEK